MGYREYRRYIQEESEEDKEILRIRLLLLLLLLPKNILVFFTLFLYVPPVLPVWLPVIHSHQWWGPPPNPAWLSLSLPSSPCVPICSQWKIPGDIPTDVTPSTSLSIFHHFPTQSHFLITRTF